MLIIFDIKMGIFQKNSDPNFSALSGYSILLPLQKCLKGYYIKLLIFPLLIIQSFWYLVGIYMVSSYIIVQKISGIPCLVAIVTHLQCLNLAIFEHFSILAGCKCCHTLVPWQYHPDIYRWYTWCYKKYVGGRSMV